MIVRVRVFVCRFQDGPSGGTNIVENASNAAMELWLSARSPGWRLLAALLSHLSLNHPVKSGHFLQCHGLTYCSTSVLVLYHYTREVCVLGTPSSLLPRVGVA